MSGGEDDLEGTDGPDPAEANAPVDPDAPALPAQPPGTQARRDALKRKREQEALERLQSELDEVEAHRMPLMEHLIELRNRLAIAITAVVIGSIGGFIYAKEIYDFLKAPFVQALADANVGGGLALVTSPFEGVYTYFKVAFIAGVLFASPVVSWQIWAFVAPGLYRSERQMVTPLAMSSAGLFLGGAAFCFYGIFPFAFPFFIDVLGVDVNLSVDGYLSSVIRMTVAFGLCFQVPVVSYFVARAGLVNAQDMLGAFRYVAVLFFVLAALITPPDPLTMVLLAAPMNLLYVIGIAIAAIVSTKEPTDEGGGDDVQPIGGA